MQTKVTNCSRTDTMKAMIINFDEWPDKEGLKPATGPLNGYHWRKFLPNADWSLVDSNNDVISKAEFHVEYFEAIRMESHFDEKFVADIRAKLDAKDTPTYEVLLTRAQLRAMCHALAEHDKAKDKLRRAKVIARTLNKVLTP